ncbi:MAG: ABC transporter permease subunit [Planctomycetales bacterium]|nr:ABC transporter permease subunit [Planctomycetales bacterium]
MNTMLHNPVLFAAAPDWVMSWVTTLWLLSLGCTAGLLLLLFAWAVMWVVWRRAAKLVPLTVSEGVLLPVTWILAGMVLFAVVGYFISAMPNGLLESLVRLPLGGSRTVTAEIPVGAVNHPVPINLEAREAVDFSMSSDEIVDVTNAATPEEQFGAAIELGGANEAFAWTRRTTTTVLLNGRFVENLYVTNLSDLPAKFTVKMTTGPVFPEVKAVPITAIAVFCFYAIYLIQSWFFPRLSAIALSTSKSELAQPLFGILLALGIFFLLLFLFLPYNTFGEDIKMLKDSGLTLIMIFGIVLGVWSASNSVAEEIEGRTALTVLSKPISRWEFILGKLSGILWTVSLLFIFLGLTFLVVIAYKPVFDGREMGLETPDWTSAHMEVMLTVPGLVLAFFEVAVLTALSVAISTRLPMMANFVICFAIYVLGHITPLIVQAPIQFAPVVFVGQFIATILPVLDHFNIQAAIAAGKGVPMVYLGWSFVYCLLYSGIAVLLALALFEDRDLA